jgi:hypothetical protein
MEVEHPRWGLIQSVTALKDIKAGQEVFTYYGYGSYPSKFPADFPWYFDTKAAVERDERLAAVEEEKNKLLQNR